MRSRTGCLTCRQRKVKCDEGKPMCGQCTKASRECTPSSGIVFRHQHNASMNGEVSGDENSLKGFYAYKNKFDEDAIWMDIPKHAFINVTNSYFDRGTSDFDSMSTALMESPGTFEAQSLPSWRTHSNFHSVTSTPSSMGPDLPPTSVPFCYTPDLESLPPLMQSPAASVIGTPLSPPLSLCNRRIHPVMDFTSTTSPPIAPHLNSPYDSADHTYRSVSMASSRRSPPRSDSGISTQHDHEIASLLRWFAESPANWMDLFDPNNFFASYVPVQAREKPLLKYAAVACAAKAQARVQGRKSVMGYSVTCRAGMEQNLRELLVDWDHRAVVYYGKAISLLLKALKRDPSSLDESEWELRYPNSAYDGPSLNPPYAGNTDELPVVLVILCVYEWLNNSTENWAIHLEGAKSLLVPSQEHVVPLQLPISTSSLRSRSFDFSSKARRATFWNIARQDMLAAFINKTNTRLDTEDLSLWKEAGLRIDDQGYIMPSNTTACGFPEDDGIVTREDLICNALVWLMAKLVNFIAAGGEVSNKFGVTWARAPQRTILDYTSLQKQFEIWHNSVPGAFQSSPSVPSQASGPMSTEDKAPMFTMVSYSDPKCASTMQMYHMSQILLFMNNQHNSTQSDLATCQMHSRKIVGISLAQSDEAVRIHSVQPLFTAGQCLRDTSERDVVLSLLRDIKSDTGWTTDYRVQQLSEQWQCEESEGLVP